MKSEDLINRIKKKDNTDDDWLQIHKDILEFLDSDPPPEEKIKFVPLGWLESVSMICDGILRKRGAQASYESEIDEK